MVRAKRSITPVVYQMKVTLKGIKPPIHLAPHPGCQYDHVSIDLTMPSLASHALFGCTTDG